MTDNYSSVQTALRLICNHEVPGSDLGHDPGHAHWSISCDPCIALWDVLPFKICGIRSVINRRSVSTAVNTNVHILRACGGEWRCSEFDVGVSFTPRPLYLLYRLNRTRNIFSLLGVDPRTVQPVTWLLYRLSYPNSTAGDTALLNKLDIACYQFIFAFMPISFLRLEDLCFCVVFVWNIVLVKHDMFLFLYFCNYKNKNMSYFTKTIFHTK